LIGTTVIGSGTPSPTTGIAIIQVQSNAQVLSAGQQTVAAEYAGDNVFADASITFIVLVPSTLTFSISPSQPVCGQSFSITSTVISTIASTGTITLQITQNGSTILKTNAGLNSKSATFTINHGLPKKSYSVSLTYSGDSYTGSSSTTTTLTIGAAPCFVQLNVNVNLLSLAQLLHWSSTCSSAISDYYSPVGGTLTINDGASPILNLGLLNQLTNGTLLFLIIGTHPLTCSYSGDSCFNPCVSTVVNVTVHLL